MKQIKLQDKKLFAILEMRGEVFKQIEEVNRIIVSEDEKRTKLGYKMERLKEKTTEAMKSHDIELEEFDEIGTVGREQGEITVSIYNQLEEYKKLLREKKDEPKDDKKQCSDNGCNFNNERK